MVVLVEYCPRVQHLEFGRAYATDSVPGRTVDSGVIVMGCTQLPGSSAPAKMHKVTTNLRLRPEALKTFLGVLGLTAWPFRRPVFKRKVRVFRDFTLLQCDTPL